MIGAVTARGSAIWIAARLKTTHERKQIVETKIVAIVAGAVAVFVLIILVVKYQRWPEGRKRAFREKKRKGLYVK